MGSSQRGVVPWREQLLLAEDSSQALTMPGAGGMSVPVLSPRGELDGQAQHLLLSFILTVMLSFRMMEVDVI